MDDSFLPPQAAQDLTRAILARTSGRPCQRLKLLACDFVDGSLEAGQADLVRLHLEHCGACSALVGALTSLQATLPGMVELDPGPWFTQAVLRATRYRPVRPGGDFRDLWWKLMHRPRIALEAAYLGAAAGLLGIYLPMPDLALRVPALVQPLAASAQRVAGQVAQAEQRTARSLQQSLRPLAAPRANPLKRGSLWQRMSARIKTWLQVVRRAQLTPPQPETKGPPPANP